MIMCTIRVEPHDTSWSERNNLAAHLRNCGIMNVITHNNGERFKM
jgi:hypothetical protein